MKNKKLIIIVGIFIIVIVTIITFLRYPRTTYTGLRPIDEYLPKKFTPSAINENQTSENESERYVTYNGKVLENAVNTRRVLYFHANWCPTCIPADKTFQASENQIPKDVTIIRVSYNDSETDDEEKELARKYGITYQHTFVQIDPSGNEVTKWNGGQLTGLLENLK